MLHAWLSSPHGVPDSRVQDLPLMLARVLYMRVERTVGQQVNLFGEKERDFVRLGFETMECKMMHDMFMEKWTHIFEGFIKVDCKHRRGTWFYLKIVKTSQSVPFSKVRTTPRKRS